ncbi:Keratin, type II cytoskeletal 8 [Plecturocebus cupreus]
MDTCSRAVSATWVTVGHSVPGKAEAEGRAWQQAEGAGGLQEVGGGDPQTRTHLWSCLQPIAARWTGTATWQSPQEGEDGQHSWARLREGTRSKHDRLQTLAGKHRDAPWCTKTQIAKMNPNVRWLQLGLRTSKARGLPWESPSQNRAAWVAGHKGTNATLVELKATLQRAKQGMAQQVRKCQELMNTGPGH